MGRRNEGRSEPLEGGEGRIFHRREGTKDEEEWGNLVTRRATGMGVWRGMKREKRSFLEARRPSRTPRALFMLVVVFSVFSLCR